VHAGKTRLGDIARRENLDAHGHAWKVCAGTPCFAESKRVGIDGALRMKEFESGIARGRSMSMLHKTTSISVTFLYLVGRSTRYSTVSRSVSRDRLQVRCRCRSEKTLLLKDFNPTSMLHAPVHKVERAKYYVIDIRFMT
jgi:hypothetical protein